MRYNQKNLSQKTAFDELPNMTSIVFEGEKMKTAYNLHIETTHRIVALCPKCDINNVVVMKDDVFITIEKCVRCKKQFTVSRPERLKCLKVSY